MTKRSETAYEGEAERCRKKTGIWRKSGRLIGLWSSFFKRRNRKRVAMGKYIIKRLLQLIPILIGITFLSFAMMRLAGGDAVTYMYENAGTAVSQEIIDEAKAAYGLDKPFLVQYANWFVGMLTGDMGESYVSHKDVFETFVSKLPATLMLTLSSILMTVVFAIPLGILSAVKHNRWIDYLIRFLSFIGNSMPNFLRRLC